MHCTGYSGDSSPATAPGKLTHRGHMHCTGYSGDSSPATAPGKLTHSGHSNMLSGILSIQMQIRTIWKGFEAFILKFEPFERDSKHLNANSNQSKGIRRIRMQIQTTWKEFEAFECKF